MTIDGTSFPNCEWKKNSISKTAEIMNGEGSGRLSSTGLMILEYDSVFYNYEGEIVRKPNCTDDEWYRLWDLLTNKKNDHQVSFPFESKPVWLYISSLERTFITRKKGRNDWSKSYKVKFVAMDKVR